MTTATLERPAARPLASTVHVRRPAAAPARVPAPTGYAATPARAPRPPAPAARPARVRLTRRGRALRSLLVLAVGVVLVTVALVRGSAPAVGGDGAGGPVPVQPTTVVQPGESLWSIAQRVAPGADPRATVLQLKSLNGLTSSDLVAGQPLLLPIPR